MSVKRLGCWLADIAAFALAATGTVGAALMAMRPTGLRQLFVMGVSLLVLAALLACLIRAVRQWKRLRFAGLLAPAALLAALPLGVEVGQGLRTWRFERDLPRYRAMAKWALARAVPGERIDVPIPPEARDLAYLVRVSDEPGCGRVVDFYWGAGFPVKHTARRYVELPQKIEDDACRGYWARGLRRGEHWFEASD
ncbi:hypothetical protein PRJ39_16115 [Lysobacter enzymogenes]|uniref:hypothetical protein n=1 Tax=Lysobacter enzymogenes TaxID=69 RepID=UPI0037494D91